MTATLANSSCKIALVGREGVRMFAAKGRRFSCSLVLSMLVMLGGSWTGKAAQLSEPWQKAAASDIRLNQWKFKTDPEKSGAENRYAEPSFDDSGWVRLNAQADWQHQGYPNHHGIGWYRLSIKVPTDWKGSKVLFHSEGIKEEYDLYINGKLIRHFGSDRIPVGGVPTEADLSAVLNYGQQNTIAVRAIDHGDEGECHDHADTRNGHQTLRRMVGLGTDQ